MKLPDTSPFPVGSIIWAYLRDSGGGSQERSVDQQIEIARAYCAKFNLVLEELFADRAREGSNADNRDELNRMIDLLRDRYKPIRDKKRREQAESRIRHGVLVWNFARLGRDSLEASFTKDDLRMRGLVVGSMSDDINTGSVLTDRLLEAFTDFTNEMFVNTLSKDVRRGIHLVVSLRDNYPDYLQHNPDHQPTGRYLGIFPGRIAPRGFIFEHIRIGTRRDGRPRIVQRLIPDPSIWERVILAWRMRVMDRASVPEIHEVTHLYPRPTGYTNFFKNLIYCGIFAYGGEIYGSPEDPFVRPAITLEWYEKEAERRALRWQRIQPGGEMQPGDIDPRIHSRGRLLSGMLVCARCGATLHATSEQAVIHRSSGGTRKGWAYYHCSKAKDRQCDAGRVGAKRIEDAVIDKVKRIVLDPKRLSAISMQLSGHIDKQHRAVVEEMDALQSALTEANRRTEGIADALALRPSSVVLLRRLDAEETNLHDLKRNIQIKQGELTYLASFQMDHDELSRVAKRVIDALQSGDVTRGRTALSSFVSKIEVESGQMFDLNVCWTFPHPETDDKSPVIHLPPSKMHVRRRPRNRYAADQKPKTQKGD